jgi:hypothetical protein
MGTWAGWLDRFQLRSICKANDNLNDYCDDSAAMFDCEPELNEITTRNFAVTYCVAGSFVSCAYNIIFGETLKAIYTTL